MFAAPPPPLSCSLGTHKHTAMSEGLTLSPAGTTACVGAQAQYCPGGAAATCANVLVACADKPDQCTDVQSSLRGTGAFATVDIFLAQSASNGGAGTPTAAQLGAYDAVLAYSMYAFADAALLGDRLAAYHDGGGGVVIAVFANLDTNGPCCATNLLGAYGAPARGYALVDYAQGSRREVVGDALGEVLEPQSPLMAGVASLAAPFAIRSTAPVVAGRGVVVARWGGGEPLVLRGARGNRTLVELNFWPVSSSGPNPDGYLYGWNGSGAALLRNALKYSRCMLCGPGTFAAAGAGGRGGLRARGGEVALAARPGGVLCVGGSRARAAAPRGRDGAARGSLARGCMARQPRDLSRGCLGHVACHVTAYDQSQAARCYGFTAPSLL